VILSPGIRLGPYEVIALIGEGGMGQVYRARDTKLDRDVALKALPESFVHDPDRLARFQREAKVLASLNHPNIAHIHGLEESNGIRALVMEFVEGEDLAQRLTRGAIPIDEALPIAKQIAEALEAAHEQGIIHRDLKPANIKVRPDGVVKILDFGLAKATEPGIRDDVNNPMAITDLANTRPGAVFGTPSYMSPEQASGDRVDKRTDIWAFGCVFYEMLVGERAFRSDSVSGILAAVIAADPPWPKLPPRTPTTITRLLHRCLEKNSKHRLRDIGEARIAIDVQLGDLARVLTTRSEGVNIGGFRPSRTLQLVTVLLSLSLVIALIFAIGRYFQRNPAVSATRFEMAASQFASDLLISPDGQTVAYVASHQGKLAIWVQPFGSVAGHELDGTANATGLFWSPDSRHLGFVADGKLKKIAVSSGAPQVLCEAAINLPGTWNRDDVILFGGFAGGVPGLLRVSASGSEVAPVTVADVSKEFVHVEPQFLPDGRHFLYYAISSNQRDGALYLGSLDSKSTTRLMNLPNSWQGPNSRALFALPGYLLFSREGRLMAQAFDTVRMTLSGEPFALSENVRADFSVSESGVLVYRKVVDRPQQQPAPLFWFDRKGKPTGEVAMPVDVESLSLSKDGQQIAVDNAGPSPKYNSDIWVTGVSGAASVRLTFDPGFDGSPIWDPDGRSIVFAAIRSGRVVSKLYQKRSNGVGAEELLLPGNAKDVDVPQDWSYDGRYIIFARFSFDDLLANDLWYLQPRGDRRPTLFLHSPFLNVQPRLSPDGRYVAYATNESDTYQIVVQSFPDPTIGRWPITARGGTEPTWGRGGRELFYLAPDGKLMAVQVTGDPAFKVVGAATPLFQTILTQEQPTPVSRRYAVTADGQRFLVKSSLAVSAHDDDKNAAPISVTTNWTAALQK